MSGGSGGASQALPGLTSGSPSDAERRAADPRVRPVIHLVRHGRVVAHLLDGRDDPPLADIGHAQAAALVGQLSGNLVLSSPLRRARETAQPLADALGLSVKIEPRVGEVVPRGLDAGARQEFLRAFMGGSWDSQAAELIAWRGAIIGALEDVAAQVDEAIVVSHYVAINAVIGLATGDPRVTCTHIDNCAVTTVEVEPGCVRLAGVGVD